MKKIKRPKLSGLKKLSRDERKYKSVNIESYKKKKLGFQPSLIGTRCSRDREKVRGVAIK